MTVVTIVDFEDRHANAFKTLNYAWIERFFSIEEADRKMLENPRQYILNRGGYILMAEEESTAIGTVSLIRSTNEEMLELAKMAVHEDHQGKKIGAMLGRAAIEKARETGAKKLFLETNSSLKPAIALYGKLGFEEVKYEDSPYQRCDIQMILELY